MRLRETLLSAATITLLGGYVGALLLFSLVVAPTAFQVLPNSELAGKMVGPVLRSLYYYGALVGPVLAWIGWWRGRGAFSMGLPLILALLCLVAQFAITPAIEEIRDLAFAQPPDPEALRSFGRLHEAAIGTFTAIGLLSLGLVGVHAHADAKARSGH
ncbi:hypothetical protein MYXO_01776 [Myxococcaceae bacterium]|jgi:hypothetical protein|nr:hypothetical protein MYXO_01776 [Myxococcaceae bacterium]